MNLINKLATVIMNRNTDKGSDFPKKYLDKLSELRFENVELVKTTDYGADIVAMDGNIKYQFRCNHTNQTQGLKAVQEALANNHLYAAEKCVVISESPFTQEAKNFAKLNRCYLFIKDDFFNLQYKKSFVLINQCKYPKVQDEFDVIKQYQALKKKLGRTPYFKDLIQVHSLRFRMKTEYGSYTGFMKAIGERFYKSTPSNEELRKEYMRIREIIKKTPTKIDLKKHTILPTANPLFEYPYKQLQIECGDMPYLQRRKVESEKKKEQRAKEKREKRLIKEDNQML